MVDYWKDVPGIDESGLPKSIKDSTRKEKISLLRRAGFSGIKGMSDEDLDDALIRVKKRIKKDKKGIKESAGTPKKGEVWLLGGKEITITKVGSGLANDKHIDFEFVADKKKSGMKIIDFFNKAKLKA